MSPKSASPSTAPILASCYATSSSSTVVQGFHYSSTGTNGCGVPEAPSGYPKSPPSQRHVADGAAVRARSPIAGAAPKGASRTIAKECERLLCRDMKRIFLGGRTDSRSSPCPMGSIYYSSEKPRQNNNNHINTGYESKDAEVYEYGNDKDLRSLGGGEEVDDEMRFIEVWDYVGGTSFRGFIADKEMRGRVEKTLFLFFEHVAGTQLKHGLMALIELATECFACDRLVICLERNGEGLHGLVHDLGWVGFELVTLAHWMQTEIPQRAGHNARCGSFSSVSTTSSVFSDDDITSEKWLFMGMEL
ncbi:ornithine decarboxylase antizyme-domain-containing protein [Sphaerosporella brunnea]|uniref:Ornithine decarboxylase antizyme n=1 Tax=Sphaerosporella brunnea TaxID=1250544 RepID=A0A5J5F2G1_9PEZI|nr:ornithine decarboxylase antizyme-domain-containing protein [Sphaerosporella brunnea]